MNVIITEAEHQQAKKDAITCLVCNELAAIYRTKKCEDWKSREQVKLFKEFNIK